MLKSPTNLKPPAGILRSVSIFAFVRRNANLSLNFSIPDVY